MNEDEFWAVQAAAVRVAEASRRRRKAQEFTPRESVLVREAYLALVIKMTHQVFDMAQQIEHLEKEAGHETATDSNDTGDLGD